MHGIRYPIQVNNNKIVTLTLEESIEQNLQAILSTPLGSQVFNRGFGSELHKIAFEPIDEVARALAHTYTRKAIKQEDRIQVLKIRTHTSNENSSILIEIFYQVIRTESNRSYLYNFSRAA